MFDRASPLEKSPLWNYCREYGTVVSARYCSINYPLVSQVITSAAQQGSRM
jgi:hypothetical protein